MSCESLARQLTVLAESLLKHQSQLTEEAFGKPLKAFQKSLTTFESALGTVLAEGEDGPDIEALNGRLESPAAKLLNELPIFSAFTKGILGKKFPIKKTETLSQAKKRFITYLLKNRLAKKAVKTFDILVRESNAPEIDSDDETMLLREIRYIGSLDDDALELAFATKYSSEKLVRKMAAAAHLRVTPKSTFSAVVKKLVPYARNSFANTSF
jgi:hypothetical protein